MESTGIRSRILETVRSIEAMVQTPRGSPLVAKATGDTLRCLLLEDLADCLDGLYDELATAPVPAGRVPIEPLPRVARGLLDLIEGLGEVYWQADHETAQLLYVSRGCASIWGVGAAELCARPHLLEDGVHRDDRARVLRGDAAGLRRGAPTDATCRIVRSDGCHRHVRIRTLPLAGSDGGIARVVGIAEDVTPQHDAEERGRRDRAELCALATELVLAEERERSRLATNLHDGLQQVLELARIKLGPLLRPRDGPRPDVELRELAALLEQGLAAARSVTFELSPPVLRDLGLLPALQWLADDLLRMRGLQVEVSDDGYDKPVEERHSVLLFRSVRELLLNVHKHASVDRAQLELRREGPTLVIEVADCGVGFDPARLLAGSQGGGFGLFSIRQRLDHLGGGMTIDSGAGRGCRIRLTAPLRQESP